MARIGILGGTFDPIHLGHLVPAQYAFNELRLDRLILVPSAAPVHRPRHMPASNDHRLQMCRLAAASLPPFSVSDVEVNRKEPSFTVLTLRHLKDTLPPKTDLVLLVGEDNLPTLHTWHKIQEIVSLARIAVLPRPGNHEFDPHPLSALVGQATIDAIMASRVYSPLVPISATDIRNRVSKNQPIAGLVPDSVLKCITSCGLYT